MKNQYRVIVVGGGSAGISVAARLLRQSHSLANEIAIIDPADKHYYQPLWTLVGGGAAKKENSEREMSKIIPEGAVWLKDEVIEFLPEDNMLTTKSKRKLSYEYLVVAAGIEVNWDGVKGLKETLGKNQVCSNYSYDHVDYTWQTIRSFKGGTALFTHPATPIKCGGAPQKIMYLAEEAFTLSGVRKGTKVVFASANEFIFDPLKYRKSLEKVVERKHIETNFKRNLIEIRADQKQAIFENLETKEKEVISYDMLHVTPPMQPPTFIRMSSISDDNGWVDVHKYTLQHSRFTNIFGLGDSSNLPTSKTGAAIRKQAPVVAENLLSLMHGKVLTASYDGYTSCPLITGYNKLILAEFDYNKEPCESMPFDQGKERRSMYMLKKDLLPVMYWDGMLKGTM